MRSAVVINPNAGSGRVRTLWQEILLHDELTGAEIVRESSLEAARVRIREVLDQGCERLIVIGGDGRVHFVANEILRHPQGRQTALGIVPAGTGCDFIRTLGIPRDGLAALHRVLASQPRAVDAIEVAFADGSKEFVVNVGSAGVSGLVDEAVNDLSSPGLFAYLGGTLSALRSYQAPRCRVVVDGELWFEGRFFVLAMANGTTFGRGMKIAPKAVVDEGLMDVVAIEAAPLWRVATSLPLLYSGLLLRSSRVRWCRGRHLLLEPMEPMPPFDLDGETLAASRCEWRVLPQALQVLC